MEPRFRRIGQPDIPALFTVRVATRENTLSREDLTQMGITEMSVAEMLRSSHSGWLCEVDGRVVGFAMGNHANGEMWVIAVLPEHEERGIGEELLTRVEHDLWDAGWDTIWLTTDVDPSLRAYGFYLRLGWSDREIKNGDRYMQKANPRSTPGTSA
jgi:ribosomal protein S18 acetylase RimI-like enzyme